MKSRVIFIVGPTATGKSEIALEFARQINGEIISADSMLVYKGMDIGTAKPSKEERQSIPHHLIDLFAPQRSFSVYDFRRRALKKIKEITKRKRIPIVVGGTGLYVRALLHGLSEQGPANPALRRKLSGQAKNPLGLRQLYEILEKKDSERAAKIQPTDARRIIRALEILENDFKRPSIKEKSLEELGYKTQIFGITQDRQTLYQSIEKRVEKMFQKGLVNEVRQILSKGLSQTASQAVGYKELIAHVKGQSTLERAKELIKINTRHLAKRQWTWFRREQGIEWIQKESTQSPKEISKILAAKLNIQNR